MKSEAWLAGAQAGRIAAAEGSTLSVIEPPNTYSDEQRGEFISGFIFAQRAARDQQLIDELFEGDA